MSEISNKKAIKMNVVIRVRDKEALAWSLTLMVIAIVLVMLWTIVCMLWTIVWEMSKN